MIPDEIIPGTGYDGLYDCGDNTSMYVFEGTDLSFFDKICGNVTASGYSLLCESDIEGNISRTYRGDNLIHIYFTPSDKKTRLISDASRMTSRRRRRRAEIPRPRSFSLRLTTR